MSALTSLYRSLTRHKLFAALNIGGLALGIATFLVLFLFVRFETGFDRSIPGVERLYVMQETYHMPGYPETPSPYTMGGQLDVMRADYPGIEGTRFWMQNGAVRQGNGATNEQLRIVDPNFFALVGYPAVAGDPVRALAAPDAVVVTRRVARKYFGSQPAIGRALTIRINGTDWNYRVAAVIADMRDDYSLTGDLFVPINRARFANEWFDHWGSTSLATILRFPDAAAATAFDAELKRFAERHVFPDGNIKKGEWEQSLRPLVDHHLYEPGDRTAIATLGVVGILTLLIAIVNYVNLATARAGLRAREVAMRKVLGGTRSALIRQFTGEAMATVALAALIGLALAELALPLVNSAGGTALALSDLGTGSILPPLALLVVVVGIVAGIYPALVLTGFQPAAVLASARAPGGGRAGARLRAALVVFQFGIAVAFAIGSAVMLAQAAHVRAADLGFQRDGLFVVRSFADVDDDAQKAAVLRALAAVPGITGLTLAENSPGEQYTTNHSQMHQPGMEATRNPSTMHVAVGPDYFETFGARLLAGRLFDPAHPGDDYSLRAKGSKTPYSIVVNRTAAAAFGFADPQAAIGKPLQGNGNMTIIGVVDDLRFRGPREQVGGVVYRYNSRPFGNSLVTLRYRGDPAAIRDAVAATWRRVAPMVEFTGRTVEQSLYEEYYKADAQRARLFTIGAVLAVLIGCIGLYGLAAFDTARRVKEIGIRKTLGASTGDVLRLLLARFMRPVVLASLLAWPVAWVAMRRWLAGFDDRIALSPWFFVAASIAAMAIAAGTVFAQSWRLARAEPARALRYE